MEEGYVNVSKLSVRLINKSVAESFVKNHHYTHKLSSARYTLGLFCKEDNEHSFFSGDNEKLIGCLVYGHPVSRATVTSIFKTIPLELDGLLELTRLVVLDGYGKNIESWFISQSFKWLRANDKGVKVLVSYADPEQGHTGLIYRATNWYYQGCGAGKLMADFSIRLLEDSEWLHSRTVGNIYGSRSIDHLASRIGHSFWQKQELQKHRYIYFLGSPRENKQYLRDLKIPIIPFEKMTLPIPVIRKINVDNGKVKSIEVIQGNDIGWKITKGEKSDVT